MAKIQCDNCKIKFQAKFMLKKKDGQYHCPKCKAIIPEELVEAGKHVMANQPGKEW
jgi:transcription initiation factor TFIIIB Brf1 subunit/transcription initiation factor TFIIB